MSFRILCAEKNYNEQPLFKNLDVELEKGDIKALVGRNGSGKTSFLRGVCGEIPLSYGKLELPDVSQWAVVYPRPQGFFRNLTVYENLKCFSDEPHGLSIALDFIADMKMEEVLSQRQYQLSLGQNSLLHMSRAFLKKDLALLMIDEVSANLDRYRQQQLFSVLKRKAHEGLSILVTAQEPEQIIGLTDVIYTL